MGTKGHVAKDKADNEAANTNNEAFNKYNLDLDASKSFNIQGIPMAHESSLPFTVNSCGHFEAKCSYYTSRSVYPSYIMIHTLDGAGHVVYRDKDNIVKKGSVALINCMEQHYYGTADAKESGGFWSFNYIHFNGNACEEFDRIINGDSFNILYPDEEELKSLFSRLVGALKERGALMEYHALELMTCIMTRIVESKLLNSPENPTSRYSSEINMVLSYIHQNYANNLNVSKMAAIVPMSRYHFIRIFKEYTGVSPYEYLILFRINKAKTLLKETGLSVCETAYKVGFRDASNFIRYFKKVVGTTPDNFRRYWIG